LTKTGLRTLRASWDNTTDLNFPIRDYHPINEQFHQHALLLKRRFGQALVCTLAELSDRRDQARQFGLTIDLTLQRLSLLLQGLDPLIELLLPTLLVRQRGATSQVGVGEACERTVQ
jgi:hypothetical protein